MIAKWWFKPARWWEFWLPQSGLSGGALTAALMFEAFAAYHAVR